MAAAAILKTEKGAPCDAVSVHFGPTKSRTDILVYIRHYYLLRHLLLVTNYLLIFATVVKVKNLKRVTMSSDLCPHRLTHNFSDIWHSRAVSQYCIYLIMPTTVRFQCLLIIYQLHSTVHASKVMNFSHCSNLTIINKYYIGIYKKYIRSCVIEDRSRCVLLNVSVFFLNKTRGVQERYLLVTGVPLHPATLQLRYSYRYREDAPRTI